MNWRQAFLLQAESDYRVLQSLENTDGVEDCHRLHYLQMMSEKLAKGYLADDQSDGDSRKATHAALVRLLQTIKSMPYVRQRLRMEDTQRFNAYIKAMLPLAEQIQALAPAIAGFEAPNPEYPWLDKASGSVVVPCQYEFRPFSSSNRQMIRLMSLLHDLLLIGPSL